MIIVPMVKTIGYITVRFQRQITPKKPVLIQFILHASPSPEGRRRIILSKTRMKLYYKPYLNSRLALKIHIRHVWGRILEKQALPIA